MSMLRPDMKDEMDFSTWYALYDLKAKLWESAQHTMQEHHQGIATTNGNFDLFHVGHFNLLREAQRLAASRGYVLYVLVNTDFSVALNRGPRPCVPLYYRMKLIQEILPDVVVWPMADQTPQFLLEVLRPKLHIKGDDWVEKSMPETDVVTRWGGRIYFIPIVETIHSTDILRRALETHKGTA